MTRTLRSLTKDLHALSVKLDEFFICLHQEGERPLPDPDQIAAFRLALQRIADLGAECLTLGGSR